MQVSQLLTTEDKANKNAAHASRHNIARGLNINDAISSGKKLWDDLSKPEQALLDDFASGKLKRDRDECDAAFKWNKHIRSEMGCAATSMGQCSIACPVVKEE